MTGHCLCNNPRTFKEATALAQAGYDVEVLGAWIDVTLASRDRELLADAPFRFTPVIDLTKKGIGAGIRNLFHRARGKSGRFAVRYGSLHNRWQFGPAAGALYRAARARAAGMYIGHLEAGLFAARRLLNDGENVGVDMEDWYSEDLLPETRARRPLPLLREIEAALLTRCTHATSPSRAMSSALAEHYRCRPPATIYNAFPWADRERIDGQRKARGDSTLPSIHWASQTIGPGRGLEDLFRCLPLLRNEAEIHLRGTPARGAESWVAGHVPQGWRHRVYVHPPVTNAELLSRIAEHDIGFCGEQPYCRNNVLTVSNKCQHYLLGGLAVVASDTEGQREVAAQAPDAVALYPSGDAAALAEKLDRLLGSKDDLQHAKAGALRAAERMFCWERQQKTLLDSVAHALRPQSH